MNPTCSSSSEGAIEIFDCAEKYAAACERLGGSVYHALAWQEVANCYNLRSHWLVAQVDGSPIGMLPLIRQSSMLFGTRLMSLPWVDEAGAIGDDGAVLALLNYAEKLAMKSGPHCSVTLKQPVNTTRSVFPDGWSLDSGCKILMRRRLATSSGELWKGLSAKVRNQIRKSQSNNLLTEKVGVDFVEEFYRVYSQNMRDLGSPSHSLGFFKALCQALGERASIYCTRLDKKAIAVGLVLDNRNSLDIPWASSIREYNGLCANHSLYWQILSDACDARYEWFHFGRSSVGSGQYKFKKQWGAEEAPLTWLSSTQAGKSVTSNSPAELKEKFGVAQRIWTKLPLWVSRWIGPQIVRHVP